jgi:hypothetical protein
MIARLQQLTLGFLLDVAGEQEADGAVGQLEDERTVILAGVLAIAASVRLRVVCGAWMEEVEVHTIDDGHALPGGRHIPIDATLHRRMAQRPIPLRS